MERRPATTSARTRSLLTGLCLVWIIDSICATGEIAEILQSFGSSTEINISNNSTKKSDYYSLFFFF